MDGALSQNDVRKIEVSTETAENRVGNRAKIVVYTQTRHILLGSLRGIKNQSVYIVGPTCI